ncbi:MAG: Hsp20/alpha crystallin family protein [Chloroflexota bacterium]
MVKLLVKESQQPNQWIILQDEVQTSRRYYRLSARNRGWCPPTDVYETETALIVRVEIAGMKREDFSITINDRFLAIRGVRSDAPERRAYHQMEIAFGEFNSEVELPFPIDVEKVTAEYADGFLRVVLPRIQPSKIRIGD